LAAASTAAIVNAASKRLTDRIAADASIVNIPQKRVAAPAR